MKRFIVFIAIIGLLFSVTACSGASAPGNEDATNNVVVEETSVVDNESAQEQREMYDGDGYLIGLILANVENSIYVQVKDSAQAAADEYGCDFMFQVGGTDATGVIEALENMVAAGCDAICFTAGSAEALDDAAKAAYDAGVVLTTFDGESPYAVRAYIADNYTAGYSTGKLTGQWIAETYGDEAVEVGIITYTLVDFLIPRDTGMRDGLAEFAPNATIVAEAQVYTPLDGMAETENFLQAYPDMVAVMSFNDAAGLGAYQAFQAANIDDDMHAIFSVDGATEALLAISEGGCHRGTTSMGFSHLGRDVLEDCLASLNGYDLGDPIQYWPAEPVTFENVNEYLATE